MRKSPNDSNTSYVAINHGRAFHSKLYSVIQIHRMLLLILLYPAPLSSPNSIQIHRMLLLILQSSRHKNFVILIQIHRMLLLI